MTNSTNATALTEEQAAILKEERLNNISDTLIKLFPENKIERKGSYIYLTSTSTTFLGSEIHKLDAITTVFGNAGYYITASIGCGLQAVIF